MASLIWAFIGLGLFTAQFFVGLIDLVFPAIAAFIVALLSLIPGLSDLGVVQFLIWSFLSVGSIFWARKNFPKLFKRRGPELVEGQVELVGQSAVVIERVTKQGGMVRSQGTTWSARSNGREFESGEEVVILEQDGLKVIVDGKNILEES